MIRNICWLVLALACGAAMAADRPRARDIGLKIGTLPPGPLNAITDVKGVRVGHQSIVQGEGVRTGVTAILPHGGNLFQEKVPAAIVVGNGFGKLVGISQVQELGVIETPIVLTNTVSVFAAADAVAGYVLNHAGNESVLSVNPVVGETNDGFLNNIRENRIRREDVLSAIGSAQDGPVEEGSVGAGIGTRCFGFKGGIGTSSRVLPADMGGYALGVLVQSNFGGVLTINGVPVGLALDRNDLSADDERSSQQGGSCMMVMATDAPLDGRQLDRLARRALLGLGAVGSNMSHGSGDYVIAFSAAGGVRMVHQAADALHRPRILRDEHLTPLFQAAREATEEAIINSLLRATTVTGYENRTVEAISIERVLEICRRYRAVD